MTDTETNKASEYLSTRNRDGDGVDESWDQDNQQWWNWYMQS